MVNSHEPQLSQKPHSECMQFSAPCSNDNLGSWRHTSIPAPSPNHLFLLPPSLQSLSCVRLFATPWTAARQGFPVHHQLQKLAQTHVHRVGDAIQQFHPLLSPSPPALNLSQHQGLFQWVSSSHQVAKVLEFQLQHQSFNEHSGLIYFRIEWLDLLAVQGTLKSLLQHHSLKASILRHSAFFMVQLSHPHMTTGKTTALTRRTFVSKVMSPLFSMLSRSVTAFLPRSTFIKYVTDYFLFYNVSATFWY